MEYRNDLLDTIAYPLPEDIEKLKWAGYYTDCLALIDRRLQEDIPQVLRRKLEMERVQIALLKRNYTVSEAEAQALLGEKLRDWQPGELKELRMGNFVDWCFVEGEIRYIDSYYDNLLKTRPDLEARQLSPEDRKGKRTEAEIRDGIIAYMKENGGASVRLRLRARVETNLPEDRSGETLRLYLPVPVEGYQMRHVELEKTTPAYTALASGKEPQRTAFYEGPAGDLQAAEIVYSLENHTRYVELDDDAVSEDQPKGYVDEQLPHIRFTPYLRALERELAGEETNPLKKARAYYNFVTQKVRYSYMRSYLALPGIAEYAASRLRGDCGVQSLLFITLCRIGGIPARWQSGLYANENGAGSHDWAMFYVAPFGWLFADCSFGGGAWREGAVDRWNFYFGNLDPYRVVLATDFQRDFHPGMKYLRSDPYDNQRGEAELASGPLERDLWRGTVELLEARLLGPED